MNNKTLLAALSLALGAAFALQAAAQSQSVSSNEDYHVSFKFTGEIKHIVIDLTPEQLTEDDKARLKDGKAAIGAAQ